MTIDRLKVLLKICELLRSLLTMFIEPDLPNRWRRGPLRLMQWLPADARRQQRLHQEFQELIQTQFYTRNCLL